jgi:hypothetical protein
VDNPATRTRADLFLVVSIVVTVLLYVVPYGHTIGYPLMLLSTLAHEMGHGIAGWLVGGSFDSLVMWPNGSGAARVATSGGRVARAVVSAGGLVGPAVAGAVGFALATRAGLARAALITAAALLTVANVLLVRNPFGWAFVGVLAALLALIGFRARAWLSQLTVLFLSVQLALSVFSRGDYLFTDVAQTGAGPMPSDVANMADALFLPYWFWGAVCGAFSVAVLAVGVWIFLRSWRRGRAGGLPTGR